MQHIPTRKTRFLRPLSPPPRRIAKATGASVVLTLADMEGNETFEPSALGQAEAVVEERVADDAMIMIQVRRRRRREPRTAAGLLCRLSERLLCA